MNLTETAQRVLEARYFRPGEKTWGDLVDRVAGHLAANEEEKEIFSDLMNDMLFLPNSPTLMNAGTEITSYSACFVLPVEDDIESIFKYYGDAAIIGKSGGGVGANFSNLRAADSRVKSTEGVASGPVSFMSIQNTATEVIKQGGKRRGANMGILDCDHPDIEQFMDVKNTPGQMENFNLSVRVTDDFMNQAVHPGSPQDKLFQKIVDNAWLAGEPGILFGDTIERGNLVPELGELNATNPCGEQPLLPYESCVLGSINLGMFVDWSGAILWDELKITVEQAVLFLNRVLDKSDLPLPELNSAMDMTRKIGLGIMGLHDLLIQCNIPYDSLTARQIAGDIMEFISRHAEEASTALAEDCRIPFAKATTVHKNAPVRANVNLTTIAPTGTLSMIADCSSGCEPYYSVVTKKNVLDGELLLVNKHLITKMTKAVGSTRAEVIYGKILEAGTVNIPEVPKEIAMLFKSAQEISPKDHVRMQAALQVYVDSSISKTINMPADATREDVREVLLLAWKLGCKGVTVYRDGCRGAQVMNTVKAKEPELIWTLGEEQEGEHDIRLIGNKDDMTLTPESGFPDVYKLELEDRLESVRHRLTDNDGNKVYFVVCTQDELPVEVFARLPYEAQDSYWNTICRLLSLCMRYRVPLDDITKQLRKGSTSVVDMPAKLARILDEYKEEPDEDDSEDDSSTRCAEVCPECDGQLKFVSGCTECSDCGYSKCA